MLNRKRKQRSPPYPLVGPIIYQREYIAICSRGERTTDILPRIAVVGVIALIPLYYFTQATVGTGNKAPGSGQAEIKESRRAGNLSNEYRDPRDSGKKTTEADGK